MNIDFKTCSIDELLENKDLISIINEKHWILKELLTREDKSKVILLLFENFLENTNEDVLRIISSQTHSDVFDDLIKQNFQGIIKACINTNNVDMLSNFTDRYFDLLLDNFDLLINDKKFPKNLAYFLKSVYEEKIFNRYKNEILDAILDHLLNDPNETVSFDYLVMDFFIYLNKMSDDYIEKNVDKFIAILNNLTKKINVDRLEATEDEPAFILNTIAKKARKIKEIDEFLNSNIDFVISLFTNLNKEKLKNSLYSTYLELINDLLKQEQKELKDLECYNGGFSSVMIIGDKVLKTGEKNTYEIPYDKRFLQPVIREYIKSERKCRGGYYDVHECVEVYERVDTENITDDDVYLVFKELLEKGILWADASPRNLGRLLKPNKVYLKDAYSMIDGKKEDYYVDDENVGFIKIDNVKKEVLQKGDLVITDLDEIYNIRSLSLVDEIKEKISDGWNLDKYDVDRFIRKNYLIDPCNDYCNYMQMYLDEQKSIISNKKI